MSFNSENDPAGVPSYQTPQLKVGEPYETRQLRQKKNSTLPHADGLSLILPNAREERIFDDAREITHSQHAISPKNRNVSFGKAHKDQTPNKFL